MLPFTFTMIFSGGMIPSYLLIKNLHMLNTVWSMLIPGAISVHNMIIARTFIRNSIPQEMLEAAKIDGCSDTQYFFRMVLPLSGAVIAVITLYYAIGHWNAYFNAFMYLSDRKLYRNGAILLLEALERECCDYSENTDLILSRGAEAYRYREQKYIVYGDFYYLEALGKLCGKGIDLW